MNTENTIDASEVRNTKKTNKTISKNSSDLIEESIKVSIKPINEQISTVTQLLEQQFQDYSDSGSTGLLSANWYLAQKRNWNL